ELDLQIAKTAADDQVNIESAQRMLKESQHLKTQAELAKQIASLRSGSDVALKAATVKAASAQAELNRAIRSRAQHKASFSQTEIERLQLAYRNAELEITKANQDIQIAKILQQLEDSTLSERKEGVLRHELAVSKAKNDMAMAVLVKQQRELAVQLAKEMHQRREMISSIDGEIAETFVAEGQWVETGDKIARVINLTTLRVEGYVKAEYPRQHLKNADASIQIGSGSNRTTIPGRVVFVSPEVDRANRQFVVRIEFDNRQHGLTPGMAATATLRFKKATSVRE
ncbi:HlyD family efflux transporter periplasmic adaptor subunit, partial [bacterium]|nr:HlyD family efflux transporter periplasmic adaptor subunit [bacterium]